MPDFSDTTTVSAAPDQVWQLVSKVENLPQYMPTMKRADTQGPNRVQVEGDAQGHHYSGDGHFTTDDSTRRLEWGSDGENDYSGWLQVKGDGSSSTVEVGLHFGDELAQQLAGDHPSDSAEAPADHGLAAALASVKQIVEGEGGKVEPPEEGS